MRVVYAPLTLVCAVLLVLFAVSNRQTAQLGLWPLPFLVELPVYLLVLLALFAGFVVGAIIARIAGHRARRELRRDRRRVEALERNLAATQAQLDNQTETARPGLPAAVFPGARPEVGRVAGAR